MNKNKSGKNAPGNKSAPAPKSAGPSKTPAGYHKQLSKIQSQQIRAYLMELIGCPVS